MTDASPRGFKRKPLPERSAAHATVTRPADHRMHTGQTCGCGLTVTVAPTAWTSNAASPESSAPSRTISCWPSRCSATNSATDPPCATCPTPGPSIPLPRTDSHRSSRRQPPPETRSTSAPDPVRRLPQATPPRKCVLDHSRQPARPQPNSPATQNSRPARAEREFRKPTCGSSLKIPWWARRELNPHVLSDTRT